MSRPKSQGPSVAEYVAVRGAFTRVVAACSALMSSLSTRGMSPAWDRGAEPRAHEYWGKFEQVHGVLRAVEANFSGSGSVAELLEIFEHSVVRGNNPNRCFYDRRLLSLLGDLSAAVSDYVQQARAFDRDRGFAL